MSVFSAPGVVVDTEALLRLRHVASAARSRNLKLTGTPGGFVSKRRGRGLEPDEIRIYAEGDDIRHLDRNATARSGVPHVRTFRDERDRTVLLLADFRPPMLWGTRRALRSVAAAEALTLTGWQAVDSGARVGLLAFVVGEPVYVRPQGRARGMIAIIGALSAAHRAAFESKSSAPLDRALHIAGNLLPSGGMLVIATGLDDPGPEFDLLVTRLARRGRFCVCLVCDAFETKPPPGMYPYLVSDNEVATAIIAGNERNQDHARTTRLKGLGTEVFPIHAGDGPERMEVPGD